MVMNIRNKGNPAFIKVECADERVGPSNVSTTIKPIIKKGRI